MRLHLIRHGRTDWNAIRRVQGQLDSHLDETGREQARALGAKLADVPFERVYVSSSERTRETAALLFAGRELPTNYRDDLREMRLGRWEGRMWADVEATDVDEIERYRAFADDFDVAGAESFRGLVERGLAAIDGLVADARAHGVGNGAAKEAEAHVAVVSHGAIVRAMLSAWMHVPLSDFESLPPLPNCAHSMVEVDDDGIHVLTIADEPLETGATP